MAFVLSPEEKTYLLALARETVAARLERRPASPPRAPAGGALHTPCGAFVTIHTGPGHALRGCIGRMQAVTPLEETVRLMAAESAFGDPRFPPLERREMEHCRFEISALSPMEECPDPRRIKIGVHGILLSLHGRSGVFLPQVPVEQGWDLDEYLENICYKAALPPHSWEAPGARLYTFTAIVFGEE